MPEHSGLSGNDHDLLVRLNVMAEISGKDISDIKAQQASSATTNDLRFRALEAQLANKFDRSEGEQLKQFRWWMAGFAALPIFLTPVVVHFWPVH